MRRPCRIRSNHGGRVSDFEALAKEVVATKRTVIIEGYCASACAMMADLARPNVWIGFSAKFHFHMTSAETPPPASSEVEAWVRTHGG